MIPETDAGHLHQAAMHLYQAAINEQDRSEAMLRPSSIYKPRLFIDGDKWCAQYGENLMEGVSGFGSSPSQAYSDFDLNWQASLKGEGAGA